MLFMDVPPDVPAHYAPVVIAQASQAQDSAKTDLTIGVCHLVNVIREDARPDQWKSPVYGISPLSSANIYLHLVEKRDQVLEGKVTLLQGPEHGTVKEEWNQNYRYLPNPDYLGSDRATFLVEIGGLKVKAVYHFKVIEGRPDGGYEDKENCPNGEHWKISTTSDANGNLIVTSAEYQSPNTGISAADTATSLLGSLGVDPSDITLNLADLPNGAVGQTTGTSITLDTNAAGHNWFIDPTPGANEEYLPTSNPNQWQARAGTAAYGKMDMLSVLLHEYGHALGIEHSADSRDYMSTTLTPAGWNTQGSVGIASGVAKLNEVSTCQTRLSQVFILNERDRHLSFTLSGTALDDLNGAPSPSPQSSPASGRGGERESHSLILDAVEAALLNANTGLSLLGSVSLTPVNDAPVVADVAQTKIEGSNKHEPGLSIRPSFRPAPG